MPIFGWKVNFCRIKQWTLVITGTPGLCTVLTPCRCSIWKKQGGFRSVGRGSHPRGPGPPSCSGCPWAGPSGRPRRRTRVLAGWPGKRGFITLLFIHDTVTSLANKVATYRHVYQAEPKEPTQFGSVSGSEIQNLPFSHSGIVSLYWSEPKEPT